jgi:alpha-L-arabinofuranosidase
MKNYLFLVCFFFLRLLVHAQEVILVNPNVKLKAVPPQRVGINLNYLTDDNASTEKALKKLGIKFMRFPGGEKSDNYIWGQRPFTSANPTLALAGNCHWPNNDSRFAQPDFKSLKPSTLDFDEFMVLAKKTGAEPLIVVNGDGHYNNGSTCGGVPAKDSLIMVAREWVRYANVVKKHNIKYWMIGNESFKSAAYAGKLTAQQYREEIKDFSRAMKAIDPKIKIIVNGDSEEWWRVVLSDSVATSYIDYLGISGYPLWNWENGYENFSHSRQDFTGFVSTARVAINRYVTNPTDKQRIRLMVTETNALDFGETPWKNTNDVGHALVLFDIIGQHLLFPKVDYTFFWNTRWVDNKIQNRGFQAINQSGNLLANGQALSIWNNFLLDSLVATNNTEKVISYATTKQGRLNVFLLNKDTTGHQVNLELLNFKSRGAAQRHLFIGISLTDTLPDIKLATSINSELKNGNLLYRVPVLPHSITVLQFKNQAYSMLLIPLEAWSLLALSLTAFYQFFLYTRTKNRKATKNVKQLNKKVILT